jgi:hypothetical protein
MNRAVYFLFLKENKMIINNELFYYTETMIGAKSLPIDE